MITLLKIPPKQINNLESGILAAYNFTPINGSLVDISNLGKTGTITGAGPTNAGMNFDGVNNKVAFGNIGSVKSVAFRIKLKTTTEQILEGAANTFLTLTNAGTLTYSTNFDNAFINGVDTDTVQAGVWLNVMLVSSTARAYSACILALNNISYGDFEIEDLRFYSTEKTITDAVRYSQIFDRRVLMEEIFFNEGADGITKTPLGWQNGTTTCVISILENYVNKDLDIGEKYMQFAGSGTMTFRLDLSEIPNNAYIRYYYYNGSTWALREGYIDAPVTGVAYSSGLLTFTSAGAGHRIANIKITFNKV